MWLCTILLSTAVGTFAKPLLNRQSPSPWTNFINNPVFYPSQDATSWRTLYTRTLQLPDNSLLLTWEDYAPIEPALTHWPLYRSTDGGASFQSYSTVEDQVNGWGNWYQPHLFTLPEDLGDYKAGTILLAGTSTPRDLTEAYIDLYASEDGGLNWKFISHIVYGPGPETTRNGDKAIWEPFLHVYQGKLVVHYSTQVDEAHAQKSAHKTSTDLVNWSEEVNDVVGPDYGNRPGMAVVAHSPKSNKYVLVFEYCNGPIGGGCPVHQVIANSPLEFGSVEPIPVRDPNGNLIPSGSPYITWTELEDAKDGEGIFIMNGNGREELFVNTDAADPNGWRTVDIGQWAAHSRSLEIINSPADSAADGKKKLLISNGGNMGCSGDCYNYIVSGLVDIPTYPS